MWGGTGDVKGVEGGGAMIGGNGIGVVEGWRGKDLVRRMVWCEMGSG